MRLLRRSGARRRLDRRWLFPAFVGAFYAIWLALVIARNAWGLALENWPMALAMALGSYVAGSTPMGGGTVGFPVLVLLFDQPAALGRNFAFAIQSIGMVSASCYIFARNVPVEWTALRWSIAGSLMGTPLGVALLTPLVPDQAVKLIFAAVWASLGVLLLDEGRAWRKLPATFAAAAEPASPRRLALERMTCFLVGGAGGATVAAFTGTGVNMLLFALLVLLFRRDVRVAIATSVLLMAATSVIGLATCVATGALASHPGVFGAWLAAAPVAAIGAPLGALAVRVIPRAITLLLVAALCFLQFLWTLAQEQPSSLAIALACAGVALLAILFRTLRSAGGRLTQRPRA